MSFTIQQDGEWFTVRMRRTRIRCCDCGLVHRVQYRTVRRRLQMRVWRDRRATAQQRRKAGRTL